MGIIDFDPEASYGVCLVNSHPYLFTNSGINKKSVPADLRVYEIADSGCDGCFARIQEEVKVNFWGTIIGKDEIPLDEGAYYPEYGSEEYEGTFVDEMTLEEYLKADPAQFGTLEEVPDGEIFLKPGHSYRMKFYAQSFRNINGKLDRSIPIDAESLKEDLLTQMEESEFQITGLQITDGASDTEKMLEVCFTVDPKCIGVRTMVAADLLNCCDGVDIYSDGLTAEPLGKKES